MIKKEDYSTVKKNRKQKDISKFNNKPRMATVLQVLPSMAIGGGGVEKGTIEISRAITKAGGKALVSSSGGQLTNELKRINVEHFKLPLASKNPVTIYRNIDRLVNLIKLENIDIIHARSRAPAWSAYFAAKKTGKKFITTFHGTYGLENSFKRNYNSVMIKGEKVIAISNFIAAHIHKNYGVPSSKIRTIYRGVDLNRFSPEKVSAERVIKLASKWRVEEGLPIIMLPGRLTRWKGHVVFIKAIAALKRRDIRCLIVGSDQGRVKYRKHLGQLIEEHDLGEIARLVDHCNDMPAALMLSDVVVSASTDPEAFGRVIAEAQSLGRLVIGPDHGGARELIVPGKTGWLVPPGNIIELSKALHDALLVSQKDRNLSAAESILNIRNNFSEQLMCDKTLKVYDEVLNYTNN